MSFKIGVKLVALPFRTLIQIALDGSHSQHPFRLSPFDD